MPRLIFAIGLITLLWATAARTTPVASGATAMTPPSHGFGGPGGACAVDGDSRGPSDPEQQWRNAHHAIAVVTESQWKSAPVHAGLGATRIARGFELARLVSSPDPPAASAPHYLRHTPLLI